jgi:DNA-binding transcriptional regulator of glucitol operon
MACNLTRARGIDCKDTMGGLRRLFLVKAYANNILENANIVETEMLTAGFSAWSSAETNVVTVHQYNLIPNLSSMTVNVNSDNANGTAFFNQTLSVTLQKIDHDSTNELRLMAYSRSQIFVEDSNNNCFLLGVQNGCHVTGGTVVTGAALGDMNGYTIEWGAEEKDALIQVVPSNGIAVAKAPFDQLTDVEQLAINTPS